MIKEALQRRGSGACGKTAHTVILSVAKDPGIGSKIQLPGSFATLRMTAWGRFSAACKAPPFQKLVRNPG